MLINGLCAILALLLLWAAVVDIRTYTISNRLNLAIALMAPIFWWATGADLWPDIATRIAVAAILFMMLAMAFQIGAMGGGDVKMAAALALWFSPGDVLLFVVLMSLAGGVLTIIVLIKHRIKKISGRPEVPYGVAIAFGGFWLISQWFLNQFAR